MNGWKYVLIAAALFAATGFIVWINGCASPYEICIRELGEAEQEACIKLTSQEEIEEI